MEKTRKEDGMQLDALSPGTDVLKQFTSPTGLPLTEEAVEVELEEGIKFITEQLTMMIESVSLKELDPSFAEELRKYFESLVWLRVQYCAGGKLPNGVNREGVWAPAFMYPILTSIGVYEDPSRGLRIVPKNIKKTCPMGGEEMLKFAFRLRSNHVTGGPGITKARKVEDDSFYRISVVEGEIRSASVDVHNYMLLVRTVVRAQYLETIFGKSNTSYLRVEQSRSAWEAIATKAVVNRFIN